MPAAAVSVTEANLFQALGDFITGLVACEVVRGQQNRSPMPQGDFIAMSPAMIDTLAMPVQSWTDSTTSVKQSKQWAAQIDCYGETSNDTATLLTMMLRTPYACDAFAAYGWELQPLYAEEPRQLPLVAGEEQYVQRWTFNAVLQYNPSVTVAQQTANQLSIGTNAVATSEGAVAATTGSIINVDTTYPV